MRHNGQGAECRNLNVQKCRQGEQTTADASQPYSAAARGRVGKELLTGIGYVCVGRERKRHTLAAVSMQHGIAKQTGQHKRGQAKAQTEGHQQRVRKLEHQVANAKNQQAHRHQNSHVGQCGDPEFAKGQPIQRCQTGRSVPADARTVCRLKTIEDRHVVSTAHRPNGRTVQRRGDVFLRGRVGCNYRCRCRGVG